MNKLLSLCIIVKDEEDVLERCLNSVEGHVDEIVVVDTGSTDRTLEIAGRFTDNIHHFDWIDDFAAARNFAQSKASGEWILVLDADEYVEPDNLKQVKEQLRHISNEIHCLIPVIYNFCGTFGEKIFQHYHTRLYRNAENVKFQRSIHEQVVVKNGVMKTDRADLVIYHTGYMNKVIKEKNKSSRNTPLIEAELKKADSGFDYFNLGNEFTIEGNHEKALEMYKKAFTMIDDYNFSWVQLCLIGIIEILTKLGREQEALKVIADAEKIWTKGADLVVHKASIYLSQHRMDDAKSVLIQMLGNMSNYFTMKSVDALKFAPYYLLGQIYKFEGDNQEAVRSFATALNFNPNHLETKYFLLDILGQNNPAQEVIDFIDRNGLADTEDDRINLCNLLIIMGQTDTAASFINRLRSDSAVTKLLSLKHALVEKNYEEAIAYLRDEAVKPLLLARYMISTDEILITALAAEKAELVNEVMGEILSKHPVMKFWNGELSPVWDDEQSKAIEDFLEHCLVLKQDRLVDEIVEKSEQLSRKLQLALADKLYARGREEKALAVYLKRNDTGNYGKTTFVNLIKIFKAQHLYEEALQFSVIALSADYYDFRIFQSAIETAYEIGNREEAAQLCEMAKQHYADSEWLKTAESLIETELKAI
ncbi:MAG TPA: glycosyltransferase [Bacillales bacterium]|nr:glycosyltransferase [Bacillales bacterium]